MEPSTLASSPLINGDLKINLLKMFVRIKNIRTFAAPNITWFGSSVG